GVFLREFSGMISKRFMLVASLGLLAMIAAPATFAAPAPTRWVNDDKPVVTAPGQNCNKPGYNTIQSAINASAPGDTVRVCAGNYAGAIVDRAVKLDGDHGAIIDSGPISHGILRTAFQFNMSQLPARPGSGATIQGFTIVGATQFGADDGMLDFGVFSRGTDNVTVYRNDFSDLLQSITDWNGTNWDISHNDIADPWTRCGGGIGILVGGFDGTTAVTGNSVAHNDVHGTLQVSPTDCGGYSGTGIVLYSDHRSGRPGALTITDTTVEKNDVDLTSDTPGVVDVTALELTVAGSTAPVISGNLISKNKLGGAPGYGIVVSDGSQNNVLEHNHVKGATVFSCEDDSVGTGTAGTANTWDKNKGDSPSLPAGICD
ncbi:MAG: right-handed parallel beta-helix repeat-containing protein, partial [Chloroflexota bacterium]